MSVTVSVTQESDLQMINLVINIHIWTQIYSFGRKYTDSGVNIIIRNVLFGGLSPRIFCELIEWFQCNHKICSQTFLCIPVLQFTPEMLSAANILRGEITDLILG